MRNSSIWSDVDFEKEVIFHEFDFETSSLELEVSKSSIRKHTTSYDKGVFSFIIISQLWRPLELKFSQVHILCILCWDTPTVKTSLWQLPIVSTVFKKVPKSKHDDKNPWLLLQLMKCHGSIGVQVKEIVAVPAFNT